MKTFIVWLSFMTICGAEMGAFAANPLPPASSKTNAPIPDTNLALSPETSSIEEGKALYENGQMIAALGKFMTVLRKDPHNTEARQYLRMIVDIMRQNPSITASKMGSQQQAVASNPAVEEEIRRMLQLRSRLLMDLKAIPSVEVNIKGNVNQVWIDSSLLFADNSGGIKEQGVPVLDRVSAWLKTYGQQPVIIHCYPEELQETATNGSLFLKRYSELFNFFVEEKKLPAQRFVSADLLTAEGTSGRGGEGTPEISISTSTARVVIETIGSQSAMLDAMPSMTSTKALSQWLENSITLNRKAFNPEEGEWVDLDVASLSRAGLRSWKFSIVPSSAKAGGGKSAKPVFQLEGKGNILRRVSWDGHNQKTGNFARAGSYAAKLIAINSDGTIKTLEEVVQVERTTKEEPAVLINKRRPPAKTAKKPKAKPVPAPAAAAPASEAAVPASSTPTSASAPAAGQEDSDSLIGGGTPPATPPAADAPAATEEVSAADAGDSVHSIWKQVIQFEPGESELKPTVKASLERIGKTLEVYPLQKVRITGFAMTSEPNAAELARQRAEAVRNILVDEYHVDKKRVIVAGGKTTSEENASKVEMSITN